MVMASFVSRLGEMVRYRFGMSFVGWCGFLVAGCMLGNGVLAQEQETPEVNEPLAEQVEFFENKIRPVLVEKCYRCHADGAKAVRGGLKVDSKAALLQGGDSGAALVAGDADSSVLMEAIRYEGSEMPPDGKLPDAVIADFAKWINDGAADPRKGTVTHDEPEIDLAAGREFWCFQPAVRREVPSVKLGAGTDAAANDSYIDRWLAESLYEKGLTLSQRADAVTLLRRLSFDLKGLPPTAEEIVEFESAMAGADAAKQQELIEKKVDEYFSSPAYGERWGRHWLDVARYADSTGGGRSALYKIGWKYRDYVIESFRKNKPIDQFIVEQIAGDLLPHDSIDQRAEQLTATAFLAIGPHNFELQDKEQLRMDIIDEQISVTGKAFLAMTIGCARCHDHKFDPIPTADYYAMVGIFRSTDSMEPGNVGKWVETSLPLSPEQEQQVVKYEAELAKLDEQIKAEQQKLKEKRSSMKLAEVTLDDAEATLTGSWTESVSVKPFIGVGYKHTSTIGATATYEIDLPEGEQIVRIAYTPGSNRPSKAKVMLSGVDEPFLIDQRKPPNVDANYHELGRFHFDGKTTVTIEVIEANPTIIDAVQFLRIDDGNKAEWDANLKQVAEYQQSVDALKKKRDEFKKAAVPKPESVMSVREEKADEIRDYHICVRGNVHNLGEQVPRGFLSVVQFPDQGEGTATADAAAELKKSITKKSSGRLELAQWISHRDNPLTARVFVNRVWSKLFGVGIVRTVDNFGVPGEVPSHPELLDALAIDFMDHDWNAQRLIRAIVLSKAYQQVSVETEQSRTVDPENRLLSHQNRRRLDAEAIHDAMLFASGELIESSGGDTTRPGTNSEYGYQFDVGQRAVYYPIFRNRLPEILTVFDFPNPNLSSGKRNVSTLSTQSLFMMNSPFALDRATKLASQVESLDEDGKLETMAFSILGRQLNDEERNLFKDYLQSQSEADAPWERLAQTLFGSVDFRYLK